MTETARPITGYMGFALGALALLLALVQIWAGPFAPRPELSVSLGELAANTGKAAMKSLFGFKQPEAQTAPWDIDRILVAVCVVLAGLAVILGALAFIRHETHRPATAAVALGVGAIMLQLFSLVLGVIAVLIIVAMLGSFFGGGF